MNDETEDLGGDVDTFSADEQAQLTAMRSGAETAREPAEADKPAEATADAPEGEKAAAEAPKGQEAPEKPKTVPHGAMEEERQRRKALQKELEGERIARARLEERTNLILQQFQQSAQPKAPEPVKPPDPETDVFGAVRHVGGEVDAIKAKIDAFEKQQAEQQQRTTYFNNVVNATTAAEKAFMAEVPDYMEAANHLRQGRFRELLAWGHTEQQAAEAVDREGLQIAEAALKRRQNPAALAYHMAVQRGYTKKAPAPPAQPAAPAEDAEAKKLAMVEAGQAASKSLGSSGAQSGGGAIDAKALAAMDEDEFEAFKKSNPRAFDRLMGRAA